MTLRPGRAARPTLLTAAVAATIALALVGCSGAAGAAVVPAGPSGAPTPALAAIDGASRGAAVPGSAAAPSARTTSPSTVVAAAVPARAATVAVAAAAKPLAGLVIALDPGHQLGNSNPAFSRQLSQRRWNGRIVKGCNTTGTATNAGYEEATFNWRVAVLLKAKLEALGATVPMTRTTNSWNAWGPCVWNRGMFGAKVHARLMIQIHGDGATSSGHGFFVITPVLTRGWTDQLWHGQPIWRADLALAKAMKAGMIAAGDTPSTYIDNAILPLSDQTGMNFARIPTVTVENGNMRNAGDARRMSSPAGQAFYARALLRGIRTYLHR